MHNIFQQNYKTPCASGHGSSHQQLPNHRCTVPAAFHKSGWTHSAVLHDKTRRRARLEKPLVQVVPCASGPQGHGPQHAYSGDAGVVELEAFLKTFHERRAAKLCPEGAPCRELELQGPGDVYLVGTGPGDPGLLTLRAVQLMQSADVVLYDRLVSDEVLQLVGPQARMVYVGKQAGFHTRSQEEIHELLLAFAEAGATVVRLKGGDPYVFGRGGEEVKYLSAAGIRVHCVPGITAAAGICAELGIPMTHRGTATSVRFLTGHAREGGEEQLDATVAVAADPHTTLVIYMGLQMLPSLYRQLSAAGLRPDTPAVAVERGTTPSQRVAYAHASDLAHVAQRAGLKSPTLLIIGKVVALSHGWHDWDAAGRPLLWDGGLPPHGYTLPEDFKAQLQQHQQRQLQGDMALAS